VETASGSKRARSMGAGTRLSTDPRSTTWLGSGNGGDSVTAAPGKTGAGPGDAASVAEQGTATPDKRQRKREAATKALAGRPNHFCSNPSGDQNDVPAEPAAPPAPACGGEQQRGNGGKHRDVMGACRTRAGSCKPPRTLRSKCQGGGESTPAAAAGSRAARSCQRRRAHQAKPAHDGPRSTAAGYRRADAPAPAAAGPPAPAAEKSSRTTEEAR
jgi:hypothetical protein